jgi:hypothetical protein
LHWLWRFGFFEGLWACVDLAGARRFDQSFLPDLGVVYGGRRLRLRDVLRGRG